MSESNPDEPIPYVPTTYADYLAKQVGPMGAVLWLPERGGGQGAFLIRRILPLSLPSNPWN